MISVSNEIRMFMIGSFPNGNLGGLALNILIALFTIFSGFILGLFLALGRLSKNTAINHVATFVIETMRALPLLLIIFWFHFFVPLFIGRPFSPFWSAYFSLSLYSAVNQAEIFRGGLKNVANEQWQVAKSTGLSYRQSLIYIILPQVVKMTLPSFVSFFISLFKDTSVIYIIGIMDLTQMGIMLSQRHPSKIIFSYILVATFYFTICFALSLYAKRLEARKLKY